MNQSKNVSSPVLGILCMLFAGILMSGNNAMLKWVTSGYPPGEIMFIRGIFIWLPIAILIARAGGPRTIIIQRPHFHFIRGACVVGSAFMYITGLRYLPLADMTAISFSTPLFVTALAPFLLGEVVGWRRWSAVAVGFIGIIIVTRPTGDALQLAVLLPLGSAFWAGIRDMVTRRMTTTDSSNGILCTTTAMVMVAGLLTFPFGWKMPTGPDFALMAIAGLFAGFGHHFMIEAFRHAEAVMVSPFRYLMIVWAILLGYFIWGDLPDAYVIAGIVLVILSGLYIFHREIVRRRAAAQNE